MITPDSPILAPPSIETEQAISYILKRGSVYSPESIRTIVGHYWRFAPSVGIDPLLVIAQCIVETSGRQPDNSWWPISSWWAQRPHRNPAGLGVTGESKPADQPQDPKTWAQDEKTGTWHCGLSFESWEIASQAHIGHLLGYALHDDYMTPEQYAMGLKSPRFKLLPASYRGCAPTLRGLSGKWAVPGTTYANQIADVACRILEHTV